MKTLKNYLAVILCCGTICVLGGMSLREMGRIVDAQQQMLIQLGDSGGNTQTARAATLANFVVSQTLTARNANGVQLVVSPSKWSVGSFPASGSQATASIAAEAAVRHVVDCVSWSGAASAAVAATNISIVLRDGATGAGTIIWAQVITHTVAAAAGIQTVAPNYQCNLGLVGTTNTAMTAEFTAGLTGELQGVTITGFNVN